MAIAVSNLRVSPPRVDFTPGVGVTRRGPDLARATVAFSGAYPSGGEAVTPATVGLPGGIEAAWPGNITSAPTVVAGLVSDVVTSLPALTSATVTSISWDAATSRLRAYRTVERYAGGTRVIDQQVEVATGTDLTGLLAHMEFRGIATT